MTKENNNEWEDTFYNKFFHSTSTVVNSPWTKEDIKDFISFTFKQEYQRGLKDGMMKEAEHTENYIREAREQERGKVVREMLNRIPQGEGFISETDIKEYAKERGINI